MTVVVNWANPAVLVLCATMGPPYVTLVRIGAQPVVVRTNHAVRGAVTVGLSASHKKRPMGAVIVISARYAGRNAMPAVPLVTAG